MNQLTLTDLAAATQETALTAEERTQIDALKQDIDLTDSQMAVQYGTGAQQNISQFAANILSNVRSKDSGYAGELLTDLVIKVKDLDVSSLGDDEGVLARIPFLKNAVDSFRRFTERYEKVEVQIDKIEAELDKARMEMLKDIGMFDTMYAKNLEYFRELQLYIIAGEEKIEELKRDTIPALREKATQSGEPMDAQLVHDFEEAVNRFDKKIHDLKISKTIAIQAAPQIKLIQNNDKLLVDKIQTAILNTIPLWKSQIVIAMGLHKQQKVLKLQQGVTNTTNDLLLKNSELLKTNTLETARESERSIVDIETLKKTNQNLIETIEETIKIQKDGKNKRLAAEQELLKIEGDLKSTLMAYARD